MADRSRWKARLLRAFCVVLAVLALAALLLSGIRAARRAARASQHSNDLKQIGLAIHNFHDSYNRLPSAVRKDKAGRTLCSWRFRILPWVEAIMIEAHYNKPWDDPANRWFSSHPFPVYCWASERESPASANTNVVAITGPGTALDGDRPIQFSEIPPDTILAIEIADSGIHWMEPGDLSIDRVPETIAEGVDGQGVHVLFADCSVRMLRPDVSLEDLKKSFTIEGAKKYDVDQVLGPYFIGR